MASRTRTRRSRTDEVPVLVARRRGGIMLVLSIVVLAIALRAPDGVPGVPYKTVFAAVPDVGNLQRHSDVRIGGKRVGQIMRTRAVGGRVKLEIQLSPGSGDIPSDSTVVVRSAGLLGQRYLEIKPGSAGPVGDGGTLRADRLALTSGVPELLQTFDTETRGGLGKTVSGLGTGLLGRGRDVNEAIEASPSAASNFRVIAGAVTANEARAELLLPNLSRAAGAVSGASDDLVAALPPTSRALAPFVDRREDLRATLRVAPAALAEARGAFDESGPLLRATRRLSAAANRTLPDAPRALRSTTALLRDADEPLDRARPLLAAAERAVPAALRVTRSLDPLLTPVREPLEKLLGPIRRVGNHACDIGNFAQVWHSFLSFGVPGGGKIGPLGQIRAEALVRMPYGEAGDLVKLPEQMIVRDPYPEPCTWLGETYNLLIPTK